MLCERWLQLHLPSTWKVVKSKASFVCTHEIERRLACLASRMTNNSESTLGESEAHPKTSTQKPSPKGRSPKVPHKFTTSVVGNVLDDFQQFYLGSEPTRKDKKNAQLCKSHAMRFILHMHHWHKIDQFTKLKFLYDFQQIRE
ncbi:hypothetical protein SRHO_G00169990 [Serrasalmus rhombeus]